MINKDKIGRVLVYDVNGNLLITTKSVTFPKDFFKIKSKDLVMLKGNDFPLLSKNDKIEVVFEYINGVRMKYNTSVDICTEYQMNFHVGEGIALEERRCSFKIETHFDGFATYCIRDEELVTFEEPIPLRFKNINLGGVYFSSEEQFFKGDQVMLNFLNGDLEILSEILREQYDKEGCIDGYGCRFLNVTQIQEERLARFIFDCQLIERERRRKLNGG